jgi:hypothetical protein
LRQINQKEDPVEEKATHRIKRLSILHAGDVSCSRSKGEEVKKSKPQPLQVRLSGAFQFEDVEKLKPDLKERRKRRGSVSETQSEVENLKGTEGIWSHLKKSDFWKQMTFVATFKV